MLSAFVIASCNESFIYCINTCLCNHKIKAAKAHEAKVTVDTKDSLNQR